MLILNENYFKMSNAIFHYGLTPNQLAVYSYLICCTGQKEFCWPSVKTIAACCEISENTVRKAIAVLEERSFIRKVESYQEWKGGTWRQSNNHYHFIVDENYDTIICPHVLSALMVTEVLRRHELNLRTYFVATDYTCSPSCGQSELDGYFIPDESLAYEFVRCGVPREKTIASGIPIRKEFYQSLDKAEAKRRIGLNPEDRHLLVMCGSMGCGPIKKLVGQIARMMPDNCRISVVCGTNHRLRKRLEKIHASDVRVEAYGYVRDISTMMDSADLFLTKPGGISVTEAAQKRLPMVFVNAVAGCESYNMRFYTHRWVAVSEKTIKELAEVTVLLLSTNHLTEQMIQKFDGLPQGSAAEQIVNTIMTTRVTEGA